MVLKLGFFVIFGDFFDVKFLDIIVFDVLFFLDCGVMEGLIVLVRLNKEWNFLWFSFMVICGIRVVRI